MIERPDMDVSEAIAARRSVRGFLDDPVDPAVLREHRHQGRARGDRAAISSRGISTW